MERVRESAVEAGISREHVERAAAELGLVRGSRARADLALSPPPNRPILGPLFAAPYRLQEDSDIEGEIAAGDYELVVDTIRGVLGDEGSVSSLGRSLTWSSRMLSRKGRNVSVSIVPRGGRTRIRIDERLGQIAGGLYGGIVGGTSSVAVFAASAAATATHSWVAAVAAGLAVELTTFSIARSIMGAIKNKRVKQLARLRQELEAEVRASIASPGAR